ncbi:MAG: energy-coupling factor ABC transporter permease [Candidatus Eiseniibacteriota bacterium]
MHIPDGFLDAKTIAAATGLSAAGVGTALRHAARSGAGRRAPLIGVTAAFVFAAQMLNFPVAGGTSGHLVGGVLAAVLVGPAAAVVVMTSVLTLQCFLFNDGGVLAFGANVFNMAVLAPGAGWLVYRVVRGSGGTRRALLAAAFAAWCSVVVASVACAGELAWSGTVAAPLVLPAMAGIHMVIGLGEAAITALVLSAIARTRPELLGDEAAPAPAGRLLVIQGGLICVGLAVFLSPFASALPDGLERVAGLLGFEHRAEEPLLPSPMPDYGVPGVASSTLGTVIAGLAGTVVAFALSWILAVALTRADAAPAKK